MQKSLLDKTINNVKDIPALPSVVMQVNAVLTSKSETVEGVSRIIEKDTALTSKILRLANSSYYGLSYHVDTLSKAITILGFNAVRNLAVTVSLFKIYDKSSSSSFDAKGLWRHSLGSAIASKTLTFKSRDKILHEKAFIGGMLHDIGKLAFYINLPEEMEGVLERLKEDKTLTLHKAEKDMLGFTHSEVGALIAEKWHFPQELTDTIKFHHKPGMTQKSPELIYAVHAGNEIAKALGLGKSTSEKVANINALAWEKLGLSEKDLLMPIPKIKTDFDDIINSLKIDC